MQRRHHGTGLRAQPPISQVVFSTVMSWATILPIPPALTEGHCHSPFAPRTTEGSKQKSNTHNFYFSRAHFRVRRDLRGKTGGRKTKGERRYRTEAGRAGMVRGDGLKIK